MTAICPSPRYSSQDKLRATSSKDAENTLRKDERYSVKKKIWIVEREFNEKKQFGKYGNKSLK